ncbi:MAG: hypothetical protein F6K17_37515 [Okeania sp. SIO3C4]|nr:hypothetical protein [Okeania sp. SIO3C4]
MKKRENNLSLLPTLCSLIVRLLFEDFLIIWLHLLIVFHPKVLFSEERRKMEEGRRSKF